LPQQTVTASSATDGHNRPNSIEVTSSPAVSVSIRKWVVMGS
jgi:hypothetical protein